MSAELKRLEGREKELEGALRLLRGEIRKEKLRLIKEQTGFEEGQIVQSPNGTKYLIESIETKYSTDNPWASVRKIRKDGKPAENVQNIYGLVAVGVKVVE